MKDKLKQLKELIEHIHPKDIESLNNRTKAENLILEMMEVEG